MWVGKIEEWKNGYKVLVKREKGRIIKIEYLVSPTGELMRLRDIERVNYQLNNDCFRPSCIEIILNKLRDRGGHDA